VGPFDVPAGSEAYKCRTFANPFGGQDTDIKTYEEHMTRGSHHMFLFFVPNAVDGPLGDCPSGGLEFHPYPFTAQVPDSTLTYPASVGSLVPGNTGFMLNAHFLNVGAQDLQATLTVTLHVAEPGSATQFTATAGSQALYQTTSWDSPVPALYTPPLELASGTNVTFSCTYVNDTGQTLTFGESAQTNVMCIYEMLFYPVADPKNPTIECEI